MTLCIAALALRRRLPSPKVDPCVILAYDRRMEGVGASETAHKLWRISPSWWALYAAASVSDVIELLWRYRARFKKPLDPDRLIDAFWEPLEEQKTRRGRFGRNPTKTFELILIGWVEEKFRLFQFHSEADWQECDPIACIGRGCYVAEAMFYAREQSALRFAPEMIYRVYEALRIGSVVPTVGSNASLSILAAENDRLELHSITSDGELRNLWDRFGYRGISHVDWQETDFRWTPPL